MGIVYLAALIVGMGIVLLQLAMSSGDAGHGDAGHDVDGTHGASEGGHQALPGHGPAESGHGEAVPGHGASGGSPASGGTDADLLAIVLSVRFWTFGSLAFGLLGSLLHYLELAGSAATLVLSIVLGLGAGTTASWAFRALGRTSSGSGGETRDLLGQFCKVLLPVSRGQRGKVRVDVRGQTVDYVATTDEEWLGVGDTVLIEEVRGQAVHVGKIPKELGP